MDSPALGSMTIGALIDSYGATMADELGRDVPSADYRPRMAAIEAEMRRRAPEEWRAEFQGGQDLEAGALSEAVAKALAVLFAPHSGPPGSAWRWLRRAGLRHMELAGWSDEELVQRFAWLAIEELENEGDFEEIDRIYWLIDEVERELEVRDDDGRRLLVSLYDHPHIAVRSRAADATREVAPELSRMRALAIDDPDWSAEPGADGIPIGEARRRRRLASMSVEQLVARFAEIGKEQGEALDGDRIPRFNWLFGLREGVEQELRSRDGDQRRALLSLFEHGCLQVRLNAAKATLAVAPEAARRVIEAISASGRLPQAGDAGMCLRALDEGIFRPT